MSQLAVTAELASFASQPDGLDDALLGSVADRIATYTAAAAAQADGPLPRQLRAATEAWSGGGRSSFLGTSLLGRPGWAALHNAAAAYLGEPVVVIPGSIGIVFAAIAIGEAENADPAAVNASVAVAIEVVARIDVGLRPRHAALGWRPDASLAGIGAAVAAGRLLGLDAQQLTMAIGIAATQASGLAAADAQATAVRVGKAAADGIEAATLASHGFTATPQGIEGRRALGHLIGGSDPDYAAMTDALGQVWLTRA